MSAFADLAEIARLRVWDGVAARVVGGSGLTLAVIELEPSSVVPEHIHPHEQIGVCVSGSISFRIGGEEREIGPGGTWEIAGGVPHEVRVGTERRLGDRGVVASARRLGRARDARAGAAAVAR